MGGILTDRPILRQASSLGGTCVPTKGGLNIGIAETTDDLKFENHSPSMPGCGELELGGLYKDFFEVDAVDTGVIEPEGESSLITVTRVSSSVAGTIGASLDVNSTRGRFSVPITAVVPASLESLAYANGADHIFAFAEGNPYGDTGHSPESDLTPTGCARAATTTPGCQGEVEITNASYDRLAFTGGNTWNRNADRTWEMVFEQDTVLNASLYFMSPASTPLNRQMFDLIYWTNLNNNLSICTFSGGYVQRLDTGILGSGMAGKLFYFALSWDATATKFTLWLKYTGGSKTLKVGSVFANGVADGAGHCLGADGTGHQASGHTWKHFAVYPEILSSAQVDSGLAMLEI